MSAREQTDLSTPLAVSRSHYVTHSVTQHQGILHGEATRCTGTSRSLWPTSSPSRWLDATPPRIYRQRGTSSLQRLFRDHFPEFVARYDVEFAKRLLPSCSQKRALLLGEYLNERLLLRLPHRQFRLHPPQGPPGLLPPRQEAARGHQAASSMAWCATSPRRLPASHGRQPQSWYSRAQVPSAEGRSLARPVPRGRPRRGGSIRSHPQGRSPEAERLLPPARHYVLPGA